MTNLTSRVSNWTPQEPWTINPSNVVLDMSVGLNKEFFTTPFQRRVIERLENHDTVESLKAGCRNYASKGIDVKYCEHPSNVVYEIPTGNPGGQPSVCCYCGENFFKDRFQLQLEKDMALPFVPESERRY